MRPGHRTPTQGVLHRRQLTQRPVPVSDQRRLPGGRVPGPGDFRIRAHRATLPGQIVETPPGDDPAGIDRRLHPAQIGQHRPHRRDVGHGQIGVERPTKNLHHIHRNVHDTPPPHTRTSIKFEVGTEPTMRRGKFGTRHHKEGV